MSDQLSAGYAYRDFAAQYVRQYHSIPPWDPYMFGGIAFVGGTHGNIFYPTTWLQWFMPTDTGMNLAFLIHFVIAGLSLYLLARALGASWTGAVVAGLGYELTGIVASLVKPGHDGKLFVSALAPFLFLGLWRALRLRKLDGYAIVALITGLSILGHYQLGYYLLVAGGLWALWLTFLDPASPDRKGWPLRLGGALAAVSPRCRDRRHPGAAAARLHPVLAPCRGRALGRVGVRHGLRHADQRAHDHGPAAVQRRTGQLLGRQLLQAPHRARRRCHRAARRLRHRRLPPGPAARDPAGHRRALPAGELRWAHPVLPALVRSHADDEEGARPRHGLLSRGTHHLPLRGLRHRSIAAGQGTEAVALDRHRHPWWPGVARCRGRAASRHRNARRSAHAGDGRRQCW